jgi:hypothetical protein
MTTDVKTAVMNKVKITTLGQLDLRCLIHLNPSEYTSSRHVNCVYRLEEGLVRYSHKNTIQQ